MLFLYNKLKDCRAKNVNPTEELYTVGRALI